MMWAATKGAYLLTVQSDDFFPNPRREDENFGTMICFHRRYDLGDKREFKDSDDLIHYLFIRSSGEKNISEKEYLYERMMARLEDESEGAYPSTAQIKAMNDYLMSEIQKGYVVLPVYLLDHSGLAMSTKDFNDQWDSGQVGIIFVSFEKICEEMEVSRVTPSIKNKAEQMLREEVELYDAYLRGECYCYELYKDGELEHSCGGFTGAFDKAVKDMVEYLPDDCAKMVDDLAETDDMPSMVQTLRKHANIMVDQEARDHEPQPRQKSIDPVLS